MKQETRHSRKVLITGGEGFIGSKLLPFLNAQGHSSRAAKLNLLDFQSIENCLKGETFDTLIHLAGISHVPTCEKDPNLAYQTNLAGTALLLEGILRHQPQIHFIFASTAQVYAAPQGKELSEGIIFTETREISPQNLYAQTKWQAELLIRNASEKSGLKTTICRIFNHTHRSQSADFFLPYLYSVLSKAPPDSEIRIPVGNLELSRDIGAISDLIQAFLKIIEKPHTPFDVFNICSGTPKKLINLASHLVKQMKVKAQFVTEPNRIRPGEPISLIGSHQKLTEKTDWKPQCQSEDDLIQDFLK